MAPDVYLFLFILLSIPPAVLLWRAIAGVMMHSGIGLIERIGTGIGGSV